MKNKWRFGKDSVAHLITANGKTRCNGPSEKPKGKFIEPPKTGDEYTYCYNCHYWSIFDTMAKQKVTVLVNLMNREIRTKVNATLEGWNKNQEQNRKEQEDRRTKLNETEKKLNEREKLLSESESNIKLGETYRAFLKEEMKAQLELRDGLLEKWYSRPGFFSRSHMI